MKAQIKMFESVGVLVVFFFFIVIGAGFWFGIQKTSSDKDLDKTIQSQALQIAQRAVFMPELDCSFAGVQKESCFDKTKATAFANITSSNAVRARYFELFGFSTIILQEVFPASFSAVVYSTPQEKFTDMNTFLSPVLLYDAVRKTYAFGVINVTTFAQRDKS